MNTYSSFKDFLPVLDKKKSNPTPRSVRAMVPLRQLLDTNIPGNLTSVYGKRIIEHPECINDDEMLKACQLHGLDILNIIAQKAIYHKVMIALLPGIIEAANGVYLAHHFYNTTPANYDIDEFSSYFKAFQDILLLIAGNASHPSVKNIESRLGILQIMIEDNEIKRLRPRYHKALKKALINVRKTTDIGKEIGSFGFLEYSGFSAVTPELFQVVSSGSGKEAYVLDKLLGDRGVEEGKTFHGCAGVQLIPKVMGIINNYVLRSIGVT